MNDELAKVIYRLDERTEGMQRLLVNLESRQEKLDNRMDHIEGYRSWITGAMAAIIFMSGIASWAINNQQQAAEVTLDRLSERVYNLCKVVRENNNEVCDVDYARGN